MLMEAVAVEGYNQYSAGVAVVADVAGAEAGAPPINFLNVVTVGAMQEVADGAANVLGGLILCCHDHSHSNNNSDRGKEGSSTN